MAAGTCGVSSGASPRAYSSRDEGACVDEKTRREIEEKNAGEARRRKDAEAEARASAHYANGSSCTSAASADAGSCGAGVPTRRSIDLTNRSEVARALARLQALDAAPSTSPDEHAWLKIREPALRAAQSRFASNDHTAAARAAHATAERKRIDAIVRPDAKCETRVDIEKEVLRLRSLTPAKGDTALIGAIRARASWLTEHWCALSRKAGENPPGASFNPYTASDDELHGALMWTTLAGVVPREALMHDGGVQFREDILEAIALRTPGLGDEVLASYANEPATQRVLLERELRRLGDRSECRADETNDQLMARRARLLLNQHVEAGEAAENEHQIGLDGKQGTARALVEYDLEQRVIAMNPGTTLGSIAAGAAAARGASTEEIRTAGAAGNAAEGLAGAAAGVDPRKVKNQGEAKPQVSGARRPPGPGLGRRTRAAVSSGRNARTHLPAAMASDHILQGNINRDGDAGGFHHEAPGTQTQARVVRGSRTKTDALGVYRAQIEVKDPQTGEWVRKRAPSTFFPRHWTRSEVRTAVLHAFQHRADLGDGKWQGRLPNGMLIEGWIRDGQITSAYPKLPND